MRLTCAPPAGRLTSRARSRKSWLRWTARGSGSSPVPGTTPSTARRSGRSSCWRSWAHPLKKMRASRGPALTSWTTPWLPGASSAPRAPPPARWTACRATSPGRCSSSAVRTSAWKKPSNGWRAARPARGSPQRKTGRRPSGIMRIKPGQISPAAPTSGFPAPGAAQR